MSKTKEQPIEQLSFDPAHLTSLTTTSAKIRYLDSCGLKRGPIAKVLDIKYQWVRNVLITPLKGQ
jgi:hypothetical protein